MSQTIDTLAIEIEANAMNSVDGVRKLSRALTSLAKSISSVNGAGIGNVATNINNMNGSFNNTNTAVTNATTRTKKYVNVLPSLTSHTNKAAKSTKSLAYYFGKFYANMFLAIRGVKALGSTVSDTMDYMESFNFWDVAITSATTKTSEWEELGYENAQAYGEAFKQGLADFNQKMSGFQTDVNTGDISISGVSNLGINITDLTQFQAEIVSITSSLGLCTKTSYDTSKALSMLTADMSSLKNIDLNTVMTNFQSGLIGQSRSLYKYGIDITNATLQTYAYKYGIEKAVSEMTQAEKMQLRLLAILDQSKVSWGDLANTLNQPANQLRVLKNGIKNLAITIGKLLMPMVSAVLPYLNAMVKALQTFFTWLAKVLGIELQVQNTGTGTSDIFDGISDDADDATDSVNALKKAMTQLGIDELNINNPNSDSGSGSGASSGGIDLSDEISAALAEYEAAWEEAYANMTDKATEMADAIVKAFKEKDYKGIGTYISNGITKALQSINWDGVYSVAGQFGSGFAEFLNGLITPELFGSFGSTLAGALKTVITTALSFGETFDFSNLGKSIANGINRFFEDMGAVDEKTGLTGWQEMGKAISKNVNGILETITTALQTVTWEDIGQAIADFIGTIDTENIGWNLGKLASSLATALYELVSNKETWTSLGEKIGDGLKGFFGGMNEVNEKTGLTGWQTLGKTIGDTITGLADALLVALDDDEMWYEFGEGIYSFIAAIPWSEIFSTAIDIGKLIFTFAEIEFALDIGLQNAMILAIAEALGIDTEEGSPFKTTLDLATDLMVDARFQAKENFKEKLQEWIDKLLGNGNEEEQGHSGGGITFDVDVNEGSLDDSEKKVIDWNEVVSNTITLFKLGNVKKIIEWATETYEKFKEWKENVTETVEEWKEDVSEKIEEWKEKVTEKVNNWKKEVEEKFNTWKTNVTTTVNNWKTTIEGKFSAWKTNVTTTINGWKTEAEEKFNEWKTNVSTTVENWKTEIEGKFSAWKENVENKVSDWKDKVEEKFSKFKENVETTVGDWKTEIEKKFTDFKKNTADKVKEWKEEVEKKFSKFKDNIEKTVSDWYDNISEFFDIEKWSFSGVEDGLTNVFSGAIDAIKKLWNNFAKWINQKLTIKIDTDTVIGSGISSVLGTDTITLGSLPTFANGGITSADIFAANENGVPELIGTIGRKTAIASGTEVTGIADAVYNTANEEIRLLREQNALLTKLLAKDTSINIGDKAIAQANIRGQRQLGMTLRTT